MSWREPGLSDKLGFTAIYRSCIGLALLFTQSGEATESAHCCGSRDVLRIRLYVNAADQRRFAGGPESSVQLHQRAIAFRSLLPGSRSRSWCAMDRASAAGGARRPSRDGWRATSSRPRRRKSTSAPCPGATLLTTPSARSPKPAAPNRRYSGVWPEVRRHQPRQAASYGPQKPLAGTKTIHVLNAPESFLAAPQARDGSFRKAMHLTRRHVHR